MFLNLSPFTKLHVCHKLDWDRIRSGCDVWVTGRTETQSMDRVVSDQHSGDKRNRIFLPVSRCHARDRRRNHLSGRVGSRDRRTIRSSSRRSLALDLCGDGDDLPLLECFRSSRATLSKSAGPESFGAHAVRTAICRCATGCARAVCLAYYHRRNQVSR